MVYNRSYTSMTLRECDVHPTLLQLTILVTPLEELSKNISFVCKWDTGSVRCGLILLTSAGGVLYVFYECR